MLLRLLFYKADALARHTDLLTRLAEVCIVSLIGYIFLCLTFAL